MNTPQTIDDKKYMQTLGAHITTLRKKNKHSVLSLKKQSGVSRPTIKDMEEANRSFHFIGLLQIARALNTTPAHILKEVEKNISN
jgi:transcriptional regulator with XRE-family HTH domain